MTDTLQRQKYTGGGRKLASDPIPYRPTFEELCDISPEYLQLVAEARNETEIFQHMTPEEVFRSAYRWRLVDMVGLYANGPEIMRTKQAYDVGAGKLYRALYEAQQDWREVTT